MAAIIKRSYQDHSISYREDGWFNATEAAAKFGKAPYEWQRLPETVAYIAALESRYGKIPYVKTSKARADRGGGTWLHPKLAVAFARWLDPDFAVWCDMQIDNIVRGRSDWKHSRHIAASSYMALSTILHDVRAQDGKETLPHHYANEARLVNWALTGEFLPIDRTTLSKPELDLLGHLEVKDISMVGRGVPYEQRKKALKLHADDWRNKHGLPAQLSV